MVLSIQGAIIDSLHLFNPDPEGELQCGRIRIWGRER